MATMSTDNPCPWCGIDVNTEDPFIEHDMPWHEECYWSFEGTHPMWYWLCRYNRAQYKETTEQTE